MAKYATTIRTGTVYIEDRRYVVCVNAEEVESDRLKRETIVAALREQLHKGDKSLVGNKGYRQYLKVEGEGHFAVDEAKLKEEARAMTASGFCGPTPSYRRKKSQGNTRSSGWWSIGFEAAKP